MKTFTEWLKSLREPGIGYKGMKKFLTANGFHHTWGHYINDLDPTIQFSLSVGKKKKHLQVQLYMAKKSQYTTKLTLDFSKMNPKTLTLQMLYDNYDAIRLKQDKKI